MRRIRIAAIGVAFGATLFMCGRQPESDDVVMDVDQAENLPEIDLSRAQTTVRMPEIPKTVHLRIQK